jgi:hypothetical protein
MRSMPSTALLGAMPGRCLRQRHSMVTTSPSPGPVSTVFSCVEGEVRFFGEANEVLDGVVEVVEVLVVDVAPRRDRSVSRLPNLLVKASDTRLPMIP